MLATRDSKGIAIFRTNFEKVQQQIVELEKANPPPNLAALLANVKVGVGKYAEAFEKAGPNLMLGDELYYEVFTPMIAGTIGKLEARKPI